MSQSSTSIAHTEADTRSIASKLAGQLRAGDIVLLEGELGTGKTTFVRGVMEALDYSGAVRSPTFNLIQIFETKPPVMHADLYRVKSHEGVGIEEYLDTHLCFIEWPDRCEGLVNPSETWYIQFKMAGEGREITITPPVNRPPYKIE